MKNVLHWKLLGIVIFKFVNNYQIDCDIVLKYLNFRIFNGSNTYFTMDKEKRLLTQVM